MIDRVADGRTDLVFDLVAAGRPPTALDANGVSVLKWCAYHGDVSAIRFLLSLGERLESLGDDALNGAAYHGHWKLCQFLLERGADVNRPLPDTGETPLHAALCVANRPAYDLVVAVLLDAGADPGAVTNPGVETGCFMRDARARGETPLHRAAAFGLEASIDRLLAAGASVEAHDVNGDTPLAWASWHLRPDSILRKLCHGPHRIRPDRDSRYDHGLGWGLMECSILGEPHLERERRP